MLMAFIITISIFPFPKQPALFYSLCYIIVATLFFFPYQRILLLMTGISGIYLLLVALFRPQEVAIFDRFSAVTTWPVSYTHLSACTRRISSKPTVLSSRKPHVCACRRIPLGMGVNRLWKKGKRLS